MLERHSVWALEEAAHAVGTEVGAPDLQPVPLSSCVILNQSFDPS